MNLEIKGSNFISDLPLTVEITISFIFLSIPQITGTLFLILFNVFVCYDHAVRYIDIPTTAEDSSGLFIKNDFFSKNDK